MSRQDRRVRWVAALGVVFPPRPCMPCAVPPCPLTPNAACTAGNSWYRYPVKPWPRCSVSSVVTANSWTACTRVPRARYVATAHGPPHEPYIHGPCVVCVRLAWLTMWLTHGCVMCRPRPRRSPSNARWSRIVCSKPTQCRRSWPSRMRARAPCLGSLSPRSG